MKHLIHQVGSLQDLDAFLNSENNVSIYGTASSVLVQLYSSILTKDQFQAYQSLILKTWPKASLIGGSSAGEVTFGRSLSNSVLFSALCFEEAQVELFSSDCVLENQSDASNRLRDWISSKATGDCPQGQLQGVLLLTTPTTLIPEGLISILNEYKMPLQVIGGGLGVRREEFFSLIMSNHHISHVGFVAVGLFGDQLELLPMNHLGWQAFSQTMTITRCEPHLVLEVDGKPAFDLYHRYLNIDNDAAFESNTRSFPFLVKNNGHDIARVPVGVRENGALEFYAQLREGDQFRIGYADPTSMIKSVRELQDQMADFEPEGILIYSCDSRLFLLGGDVDLETYPFDLVAPTAGFYTTGEYCGYMGGLATLNSTFVVLGLKENTASHSEKKVKTLGSSPVVKDYWEWRKGYTDQDILKNVVVKDPLAVSRLVKFISVITEELESSNQALEKLSIIDKLTQLYNRMKLDEIMSQEVVRAKRYGSTFTIIMLDVDYFKQVNDLHGHLVGDQILVEIGQLLKASLNRESDVLGRWGGEEFLIILPENELDQGIKLASKLRQTIAKEAFSFGIKKTCSFGVTTYKADDTEDSMLIRADQALLRAKELGRNRVEFEFD